MPYSSRPRGSHWLISERRRVLRLWPKKFQQRLLLLGVHLKDQELQKFIICQRRLVISVDDCFLYLGLVLFMLNYVIFLVGFALVWDMLSSGEGVGSTRK